MRRLLFIGAGLLSVHSRAGGQSATILLDGHFEDWAPDLATLTDNEAPTTGMELSGMQVSNDEA